MGGRKTGKGRRLRRSGGREMALRAEDCLALPPTGPESLGFPMSSGCGKFISRAGVGCCLLSARLCA